MSFSIIRFDPARPISPRYLFIVFLLLSWIFICTPAFAATTTLHVERIADDGKSILSSRDVNVSWMESNLPVYGDGVTHYYHQGPVFVDDPDPATEENLRWNPAEDTNVRGKDMGAVKGTNLRDLCDLVGGMKPGDRVTVLASDGFSKTFAYKNVYEPTSRQGPIVITWYRDDDGYVPNYTTGMRLVFFADNSTNPWGIHAFGNWDWHESADPEYYYYYVQGGEGYPTTTGLSVQQVASLIIYTGSASTTSPTAPSSPVVPLGTSVIIVGLIGGLWFQHRRGDGR
jgi:hypothetical protein